jgi:hypothetical protein
MGNATNDLRLLFESAHATAGPTASVGRHPATWPREMVGVRRRSWLIAFSFWPLYNFRRTQHEHDAHIKSVGRC